jgi:hypothetical protein
MPNLTVPFCRLPRFPAALVLLMRCMRCMRCLHTGAAAAVLWLAWGCAGLAPVRPPPEADAPLPDSLRQEPVVALAESTLFEVSAQASGNVLERRNVAWYRVNRRNPPLLESLSFYENENLQEPSEISVQAFYPDRAPWSATRGSLRAERHKPKGLLIETSGLILSGGVPHYDAGVVLRIETVDRYFRPEFQSRENLRGDFPCLRRTVSFRAPAGHGFRVGLRNRESLTAQVDSSLADGMAEIRITAADLPKRVPSRFPRTPESWYAALLFSVPPQGLRSWSWAELGDHYLRMIAAATAASKDIHALSTRLGPETSRDADSLAARAFGLVKSRVRYLADSREMYGWVPRAPANVWDNGYGDCKEMANLLRALLAERGVEGGLALVRAGQGEQLSEDFPSLSLFNHAIYWRRKADGSVAYLDATMPTEMGPACSRLHLLGRKTFLIVPGGSRIDSVGPGPGSESRVTTVSVLKEAGGWELSGVIGLKGPIAADLWLYLDMEPDRERARAGMDSVLAGRFGIRARELSWATPAADSVEIRYRADAGAMAWEGKYVNLDRPWLFENGSGREDQEGEKRIGAYVQRDLWTVPPGYARLAARPLAASPASGKWSQAGTVVRREFALGEGAWPPGNSPAWRTFQEAIARFAAAAACK